ncbi:hypothetical protein DSO57_1021063 [Entomophthora muscae]|uniref:Uncharacterized protein n=1 Tax=Entomophthora muscae TaxID=34485 RepID=A0ACC2T4H1_9FUNG|nr:hypothetical protein DSO57_1021063 [Entomophthora muscae]
MKEVPATPPARCPSVHDFSELGFVYITVLGLADQDVPTLEVGVPGPLQPIVLLRLSPLWTWPAALVGVQPGTGIGSEGCGNEEGIKLAYHPGGVIGFEQALVDVLVQVFQPCSGVPSGFLPGTWLLPPEEVTDAFYDAPLHHPYIIANQAGIISLVEGFFSARWIGKGGGLIPWNWFKWAKDGVIKATSSLEGWRSLFVARVKKPKYNKILEVQGLTGDIDHLFKRGIKNMDGPPKQTEAVKKYMGICQMTLACYPEDEGLEHG